MKKKKKKSTRKSSTLKSFKTRACTHKIRRITPRGRAGMEVADGHKERMNFFAWTINYALIPAPTAASLDDASSILTFALLPLLLPLPLHPPSSSPPRHPPPRDRIRPRTTKERPVHACTGREILNRVRARTSSSFPFSITIYTRIYIYIWLSLLASCSPVYRETARYLRERDCVAR